MPVIGVKEAPSLEGHTVIVRSSLNVPLQGGEVSNPYRLDRAKETLEYLSRVGARVIAISHIDGGPTTSLEPVARYLKQSLPITFVDDVAGQGARDAVRGLKNGHIVVLQNLRRDPGEESCDEDFTRKLASLGDIYVNDDFAAAHRSHASIIGLPQFLPSYAGLQFVRELQGLTPALSPESPSLAIVGGAKFVTKEPLIKKLLALYDHVFIGGALANDFFKAKGYEVGKSLVSHAGPLTEYLKNGKLMLPTDVTVDGPTGREVCAADKVEPTQTIYDVGPGSLAALKPHIDKARTIVWNGPLGNFEKGFKEETEVLAKMIAGSKARTVVGGGDTLAAIANLKLDDQFSFVSTAGGAMLSYLADGTLPGIIALSHSRQI